MASLYQSSMYTRPQSGYGPQFGNNLLNKPKQSVQPKIYGPQLPTGNVLGDADTRGGGGGNNASLFNNYASAPMEDSGGDGPDTNEVNSAFAPAIQALNQYQSSLQSQLSGQAPLQGQSTLEAEAAGTRGLLQSGLAEKKQAYGSQRTREENRTGSAVAESRRQGAEMIQGLQSKFGGSTGTGGFIGELTGRTVLQNIAQNRAALQDTIMQIDDAEVSTEREVNRQLESLNLRLQSSVQELRNNLMNSIQQINMQRGELESQKANKKIDMLNQFRQAKAEVEARNTAFQQQLYMQLQQVKQQAQTFKSTVTDDYATTLQKLDPTGRLQISEANFGSKGLNSVRYTQPQAEKDPNAISNPFAEEPY